jgi:DNA modification methylase
LRAWPNRALSHQCVGLSRDQQHQRQALGGAVDDPTVTPVVLVADALRDCSRRGGIVFDPFAGSGAMRVAAEKTGRHARLIEFEPLCCDTTVRRIEAITGKQGVLAVTNMTWEDVAAERLIQQEAGQ